MTRSSLTLMAVLFAGVVLLAGCTDPFGSLRFSRLPPEAQEFVSLMNDHRVSQGLPELQWDPSLGSVALSHSTDMRDRDFFSHTNPDGDDPFERMEAAGISFQSAGENIATGYSTGQAVFDGWIGSPGHRSNIENTGYTHHGLGYVEDGHYWTHVFARNPQTD